MTPIPDQLKFQISSFFINPACFIRLIANNEFALKLEVGFDMNGNVDSQRMVPSEIEFLP